MADGITTTVATRRVMPSSRVKPKQSALRVRAERVRRMVPRLRALCPFLEDSDTGILKAQGCGRRASQKAAYRKEIAGCRSADYLFAAVAVRTFELQSVTALCNLPSSSKIRSRRDRKYVSTVWK